MVDLGRLEDRLNQNPQLYQQFLADPVLFLQKEGLWLSFSQQEALRQVVARAQAAQFSVPGASVTRPGKLQLRVSKDF